MREKAALFALLLFCSILLAQAPLPPPILDFGQWEIALYANQSALPEGSIVEMRYTGTSGKEFATALSVRGGRATIYAQELPSYASFTYDLPSTPADDYAWGGDWNFAGGNASLELHPVADIYGYAQLFENENVAIRCPGGYYSSTRVSPTGLFHFSGVPSGKCAVFPEKYPFLGREIWLSPGDFGQVKLEFPYEYVIFSAAAASVAAASILLFLNRKKPIPAPAPKRKKSTPTSHAPPLLSRRQQDLLATLDEKEKSIVRFVQQSHPAAVKASKIRNALLIPKTSLTRTLQALERKQFLELKKDGSRLHVRLHKFYSGA